jgi:hypothetical protein
LGSFLVLRLNAGKTRSISAGIVAGHDEQRGALELFGGAVGMGAKENHAIDLTGLGSNRSIASSSSTHTPSNNRYRLRSRLAQIADGGKHIQVERCVHGGGVAGAMRAAVAAEVQRQHAKSCRREHASLLLPAFLIEAATVRQDDAAFALSVEVGVDYAAVLGGKGNVLLRGDDRREQESRQEGSEDEHPSIVAFLVSIFYGKRVLDAKPGNFLFRIQIF